MILTETLFRSFNKSNKIVITEEQIKLNSNVMKQLKDGLDNAIKNKRHIQILSHVDLDGMTSAIAIVQYLKRKGFSNDNITVTFGQYGDKKLKIKETPTKNKAVVVSDFAKISTIKLWDELQFLSDFGFNKYKYKFVNLVNTQDFTKMSIDEFKKWLYDNFAVDAKRAKKPEEKFDKSAKDILECLKLYSKIKNRKENPIEKITFKNLESYRLQDADPDYIVDHHNNEDNNLRGAKEGLLDIETPSNAAALGKILGVFSQADLDAINMIDGAQYDKNELKRATFLDTKYPAKTEERALAIKINAYIEQATKKDNRTAELIVKNSGPSLKSLSETLEKALKVNAAKVKILDALTKGFEVPEIGADGKPIMKAGRPVNKKITNGSEIYNYVKKIINTEIPKEFMDEFNAHKSGKAIDGIDKKLFNPESSFYKDREGKQLQPMAGFEQVKGKADRTNALTKTGYLTRKENEELNNLIKKGSENLSDEEKEILNKEAKTKKYQEAFFKMRDSLTDEEKKRFDLLKSKKGKINHVSNFAMVKAELSDLKDYPGRYAAALYSSKGKRFPFTIKRYSDFIQASKNPLYTGSVDFSKVMPAVKKVVEDYLKDLVNKKIISKWVAQHVIDGMNYNSGGHKAILNFQGFNEFKPPKNVRDASFEAKKMIDRIKKANQLKNEREGNNKYQDNFKNLTDKSYRKLNWSKSEMKKTEDLKKDLMDKVMTTIMRETEKLFPVSKEHINSLRADENDNELEDNSEK